MTRYNNPNDPHTDFGIYKKIKIHLTLDENRENLQLLCRKDIKYSQSNVLKGKLKYYEIGASLMRANEFKLINTHAHLFKTRNDYVVLFGVNKEVEPDGVRFIRLGRRTVCPMGALFQSIEHQGVFYKDLPITANLKEMSITAVDINLGESTVIISANVPRSFALIESPANYAGHMANQIVPIIEALHDIRSKADIDLYSDTYGQSEIVRTMLLLFSNLRIIRGINKDNTRAVREHLINTLIEDDIISFSTADIITTINPTKLKLLPNLNDDVEASNANVSHNMYEADGAYFKDKIDFETKLECKDLYKPTSYEEFIQEQKDANRAEYLRHHCTFIERLKSLSKAEIETRNNRHIGVFLAMTDEEESVWYDYEDRKDAEGMRRIELQAIERWKTLR